MENKCNEKIFENKRESERCLTRLKEEHGAVVGTTSSVFSINATLIFETNEGYNLVLMTIHVSISTEYVSSGVVKQSKLNSYR